MKKKDRQADTSKKTNWFSGNTPYLILILVTSIVYFQVLFFNFTSFDDRILIVENYHQINNLSLIPEAFGRDVFSSMDGNFYRPLLTVSFIIDAVIGGKDPLIYHLTNFLLHLACVLLLFYLLIQFNYSPKKSFVFVLLFSLHPVLVQAVAWIPGRNDILLTLFIILSLIFYLKYLSSENRARNCIYIIPLFLFYLCSLLVKETAIVFPFILGAHYIFIEREKNKKDSALLFSAIIIAVFFWIILRNSAIQSSGNFPNIFKHNAERIYGVLLYAGKIFLPVNISPLPTYQDSSIIYSASVILIVLISLLIFRINNLKLFFWGFLWFFIFLLPSLAFAQENIIFLEHRLYLPLVGVVIILLQLKIKDKYSALLKYKYAIAAGFFIYFSTTSYLHSKIFKDPQTMWQSAEATSPSSPFVQNNLGNVYMRNGDTKQAINKYIKAISLNAEHAEAHLNLGYAYKKEGSIELAEKFYKKAIELKPDYAKAYNNLGNIFLEKTMYNKAEANFIEAIRIDSDYYEAYTNLGSLYYKQNKIDSAKIYWQKSITINPEFAQPYYNLGALYYNSKNYKKADMYFRSAQRLGLNVNPALLNSIRENNK